MAAVGSGTVVSIDFIFFCLRGLQNNAGQDRRINECLDPGLGLLGTVHAIHIERNIDPGARHDRLACDARGGPTPLVVEHFAVGLDHVGMIQLAEHGVATTDCGLCTYGEPERFYSYRRDGSTGRLLSFVYMPP